MIVFPLIATVISLVFALQLYRQYFTKKRPFQLAWALGLTFFLLGSGAEALAMVQGWDAMTIKAYYYFGATLTAGTMGLGTALLLFPRASRYVYLPMLVVLGLLGLSQIIGAEVDLVKLEAVRFDTQAYKEVLERTPLLRYGSSLILNIVGASMLVGGAVYSAIKMRKKPELRGRAAGTALIALGALFPTTGGTLIGLLGVDEAGVKSISLALGAAIMYLGFVRTSR